MCRSVHKIRCFALLLLIEWAAILNPVYSQDSLAAKSGIQLSSLETADTVVESQPVFFNSQSRFLEFGDSSIKVGGYVKADAIVDLDSISDTDRFDTRAIATDGNDGNNFRLHARQTRLNVDLRHDELRAFVEVDFFGPSSTVRLRHAYGDFGGFRFGQTWSTFVDPDVLPKLLDFEAPTGAFTTRRAVARYQQKLDDVWEVSVAVEDPTSFGIPNGAPAGDVQSVLPDFVTEITHQSEDVHMRVAGFVSMARWRPETGPIQDDIVWGVVGTTKLDFDSHNRLKCEVAFGDGLPKLRGVNPFGFDQSGNFESSSALAWMIAIEHDWNDVLSSTLAYSQRDRSVLFSDAPDSIERNQYLAANLLWYPRKNLTYGVEYLWGSRFNKDGAEGEAHRIMLSARYAF